MKTISLRDLKITKVDEEGNFWPAPIEESEYYKTLKAQDYRIYDAYVNKLKKYHYDKIGKPVAEMSAWAFQALLYSIELEGFDVHMEPKIKIWNNEVEDGQHRIAVMYHLMPDSEVTVNEKGEVVKWGL